MDKENATRPPIEITGEQLLAGGFTTESKLLDPILQSVGLACLAGSSDTGKSAFLRQLAIAIATKKKQFLGFGLNAKHNSAICVVTEDGKCDVASLLHRQKSVDPSCSLNNLRFLFSGDFESSTLIQELDSSLSQKPADIVIIDAFGDVYPDDLKDTSKIRGFLTPLQRLAERHKCLILFLHHTSKRSEEKPPNKNNLLSGQGFEGKVRLLLEFRKDPTREHYRHLCVTKGNYLSSKDKTHSYVLWFDEQSLTFTNTNERASFDSLTSGTPDTYQKYLSVKQLKEQGKTHEEAAKIMGCTKGTISKFLQKGEENNWS